jgi:type I restriction enzyme S subunit
MKYDGWMNCTVGDVAAQTKNALVGGPFGSNLVSADYVSQGVPVIRGQNMGMGKWVDGEFVFVTTEKAALLSANIARPGDLVFTQRGTLGQVAIVPNGRFGRYVVSQSQMKITVDEKKANAHFLYYYFTTKEIQEYIRSNSIQTGVPHTNLGILRDTPLSIPPLPVQRAIARILGSLDDKIEANCRMNETLEAIARAIFKSWFVDFDPVRAKAEGREPAGMDAETAALFPDSFEETELGMVPRGWRVGSFEETIELIGGGTPKTSVPDYWNGDILWFSVVDAPEKSDVFVIDTQKKITQHGIDESSTKLLPKGTTIITARGTVGKCALVGNPMAMNQSCYGVRAADQRGDYFIYFALRDLVSELQQSTHGSVFDTITSETFKAVQVVIVPVILTRIFHEKISQFMGRILSNLRESKALIALRDMLLPKLLSGEIRLKDSEIMMEAIYGNNLSLSS